MAFAMPSPQFLFTRLLIMPARDHPALCMAFTLLWHASFYARRRLASLDSVPVATPDTKLGDDVGALAIAHYRNVSVASVMRKMRKRAREEEEAAAAPETRTCYACFADMPDCGWSRCGSHPCCLQCMLTKTETYTVDAFKFAKVYSHAHLTCCGFPGCSTVAIDLESVLSIFAPEMQTVHRIVSKRADADQCGPMVACHVCNFRVPQSEDAVVVECVACTSKTCGQCGTEAHPGDICSAAFAKQYNMTPEEVLSSVKKQACPGCKLAVIKDTGCNHMTCVCGFGWCWACGDSINPLNPAEHYRDAVGGTRTAPCSQFYSERSADQVEAARMKRVLAARADIPDDLKQHCYSQLDREAVVRPASAAPP
jgi:hypothetical protein